MDKKDFTQATPLQDAKTKQKDKIEAEVAGYENAWQIWAENG